MAILLAFVVILSNYVGVSSMASESKFVYYTVVSIIALILLLVR